MPKSSNCSNPILLDFVESVLKPGDVVNLNRNTFNKVSHFRHIVSPFMLVKREGKACTQQAIMLFNVI